MKNISLLVFICLALCVPETGLYAQTVSGEQPAIELTADELKAVIRKIAELRRQRVITWQRQQLQLRQRALNRKQAAETYSAEARPVVTEDGSNQPDTLIQVVQARPPEIIKTETVDNTNELKALHRRLDRQEALLLDLLDRPQTVSTPAEPTRSDTIIQQIMLNQRDDQGVTLNKEDLQALTTEVSRLNVELSNLRRRLAAEEDRRRRAEFDAEAARSRNDGFDRLENERLRYELDQNRARGEEERLRSAKPAAPLVIEKEAPVRIVRDTVYVDREKTTPVFIPTAPRTDTVTIIRETVREVPAEPVVRTDTVILDRAVVKTDTLRLKATEPISFPAIFFANNSSQLSAGHRSLLAEVVNRMRGDTGYTVRLTGFSSPSGNAAYNQQLSAKRAAAVRAGLEAAGLPGNQIVVVPGGIDYQPANAAAARRVEIQALPRAANTTTQ